MSNTGNTSGRRPPPGPPPGPPGPPIDHAMRSTALSFAGTFSNVAKLTEALNWARENGHLISPATSVTHLPPGCEVAITVEFLDAKTDAHSTGAGSDKLGLLKHALMRLALAAGVAFDPVASGRLDDESDPRYVHWRAVGAWRHLDGSVLPIVGDRRMDLRRGSDQEARIVANAKAGADKQLLDQRAFMLEHAQTKAELRAIRKGLGLRAYTAEELQKPFFVVKLAFTGYSEDPEERRLNAAAIRQQFLGGSRAMFGAPQESRPVHALPGQAAPYQLGARPPPVGSVDDDDDDDAIEVQGVPVPKSGPKMPAHDVPGFTGAAKVAGKPTPGTSARTADANAAKGPVVKFGRDAGKLLGDVDDACLQWYADAIGKSLEDASKQRWREDNLVLWQQVQDEIDLRAGGGVPVSDGGDASDGDGSAAPAAAAGERY